MLESLFQFILGDFGSHAEAMDDKTAQDFEATLGLSQVISVPMHLGGHTLDLMFCLS